MAGIKLNDKELKERIKEAYHKRYEESFTQLQYVKWAKEEYGDKSEQQLCQYFLKAKDYYNEAWKEKLSRLLSPAVDQLTLALASEDEKIRQRAIDQIMKYNGEDIQRIQAEIKGEINISFGDE